MTYIDLNNILNIIFCMKIQDKEVFLIIYQIGHHNMIFFLGFC